MLDLNVVLSEVMLSLLMKVRNVVTNINVSTDEEDANTTSRIELGRPQRCAHWFTFSPVKFSLLHNLSFNRIFAYLRSQ